MYRIDPTPQPPTFSRQSDYWLGFFFILDVVSTVTLVLDLTWARCPSSLTCPVSLRPLCAVSLLGKLRTMKCS